MYQEPDGIFGIIEVVRDFYDHGIDEHMIVFLLMAIVALDIVLGVARAWAYHEFSSRKWRKGLVSHTAMILITAIGYPFALYMNLGPVVDAFIVAMMAAYGSSILASLSALGVEIPGLQAVKKYLLTRGGKKALEVAEILANNAVHATEQVAGTLDIHGKDKMEHAKTSLIEGLEAYNINLTNDQLNTFIEAAVKKANEQWKK